MQLLVRNHLSLLMGLDSTIHKVNFSVDCCIEPEQTTAQILPRFIVWGADVIIIHNSSFESYGVEGNSDSVMVSFDAYG